MKRIFLFLFLATSLRATTYTAASCSAADVQAKINLTVNGDTVLVPSGTCTWTTGTPVTVSTAHQITLNGQGVATINWGGSGTDPGFGLSVLIITTGAVANTFLTGFTFNGAFINGRAPIQVNTTASSLPFRIWGNTLSYTGAFPQGTFINIIGDGPGLIDHNTLTTTINFTEMIHNFGSNSQTANWSSDVVPGSLQAVYLEDNTFTGPAGSFAGAQAIESFHGARTVFRHNTLHDAGFDAHGSTSGTGENCFEVNTRWGEVYQNTWTLTSGTDIPTINIRGGSWVIWGNTHPSSPNSGKVQLQADCANNSGTAYPFQDQDGRGITTSSGSSTTNASPIYLWANTNFFVGTMDRLLGVPSNYIQLNRDFFNAGPTSITRCESAADVVAGCPVTYTYSPATYPHPLVTGGGSPPLPPTSLAATPH